MIPPMRWITPICLRSKNGCCTASQKLQPSCTVDLSAFYFDIRKDALYCDPIHSTRRRACRTVMNEIFLRLTTWLAPIMCFTMEEVWQARFPSEDKSVHMELFRKAPSDWLNADAAAKMETVHNFRRAKKLTPTPPIQVIL